MRRPVSYRWSRIWLWLGLLGLWGLQTSAVVAQNRVIGTVTATIDGTEGTWFVIASGSSPEDEKSTAMWMDRGSGFALAMISAFDSKDVTFRKRTDGVGLEPVSGTVVAISFLFSRNETERTIGFPTDASDPTTVVFQPEAGDYRQLYALEEGEMSISQIEAVGPGVYRFRGTFSGILLALDGEQSLAIEAGSFVIDETRLFESE